MVATISASATTSRQARARRGKPIDRQWSVPYRFLLPYLIVFSIFWFWPLIYSFLLSFQNTRVNPWTIDVAVNWRRLWVDQAFHAALRNTLIVLVLQVPIMLALATAIALALDSPKLAARPLFRFAFFAPIVVSDVAYSVIFRLLFNGQYGAVNQALTAIGLPALDWLHDPTWMMATIIIAVTWRWTGYNAIIILAGLQTIPKDLYEAAAIDGAGAWRRFRHITLPLLKPVIVFALVLSVIGTMQLFTEPWLITDAQSSGVSIEMLGTYLFKQGFRNLNFGYASAIAYTIAAMAAAMAAFNLLLSRRSSS
ncbi:sugar ABC transporter permease [Kaistia algarum]|uniref:carbohydrate ABC transporter permease n=1 Tax=Kaistia algarum TaxID=2083279 RepID=UPI000CE89D56|nr:sugar ABC transporter permease [Kaistia algarum]MCX5512071.1 sugar ABC transporter permease [Kaistia algarum]PPE80190.1 sugar ABC transporter permease [Kaistia algarum]